MYQTFLTHLTDFFLNAHESKCSILGQNGLFVRNVHLSSGPFMCSALYQYFHSYGNEAFLSSPQKFKDLVCSFLL